jgi:low temperature requirement protein LtrA
VSVIAAVVLGLVVAASFWLAYFDFAASDVQRLLAKSRGAQRTALARDAYTYAHLPMVAGIVLFAFAMRTALRHVHSALSIVPAVALCCGSAVYLIAFVALRWRVSHTLGRGRPIAALTFALITLAAVAVPALGALALVAGVWVALHVYELIGWREERAKRRAEAGAAGQARETRA